jgi:tetratricopeptide (TPR) repeat protein
MKTILLSLLIAALLLTPFILSAEESSLGSALRLYYSGDYQGAVVAFKEVIANDPENAAAFYYLGYTYQEMGNYIAARAAFRKTYDINPDFLPLE